MLSVETSVFSSLPLHDAVVESITLDWGMGVCTIALRLCGAMAPEPRQRKLVFSNVTELVVPRDEPWGSSSQVNGQHKDGPEFQIEMQSGDTVVVKAEAFSLET